MLGLADIGNPVGAVLFLPLAQWLISTVGWPQTFRIFGVLFFVLLVPANLLLQRRPPLQTGMADPKETPGPCDVPAPPTPLSDAPQSVPVRVTPTVTASTRAGSLWRQPPVWFLVLARLLASLGTHLTSVHLVAFFVSSGYDPMLAASAIAGVGLISVVGRPLSGALSDVVGRELMYTVGLSMHMSAIRLMLALGDGQSLWPILLFIGLSGLSDGIAGLVVGAKAGDLFPTTELGLVMGLVQMGRGLGMMIGPVLGGLLFDLHGDYLLAFLLAVGLVTVAIGCMWGVRLTSQSW